MQVIFVLYCVFFLKVKLKDIMRLLELFVLTAAPIFGTLPSDSSILS